MAPSIEDIQALNGLLDTSLLLLGQMAKTVRSTNPETGPSDATQAATGSLSTASQAAQVIKGSTSKLSLLIISEPFTPSAIIKVIQDLVNTGLPLLYGSVQAFNRTQYTNTICCDLADGCAQVFGSLRRLLDLVPRDGKVLPLAQRNGVQGAGSFSITGMLWAACDKITQMADIGIKGHLIETAVILRDTLLDQVEELKDWGEEVSDDEDDEDEDEDEDGSEEATATTSTQQENETTNGGPGALSDTQAMVDMLMSDCIKHIPKNDPGQIRPRLAWCIKIFRQATILYSAIIKYRLRALPDFDEARPVVSKIDELMRALRRLPDEIGELAAAFYELCPASIDELRDQAFLDIFAITILVLEPWEGERDTFSDWILKFQKDLRAKPEDTQFS